MRILLTGATGFVGGAVLKRARSEGHSVNALVRNPEDAKKLEALGVDTFLGSVADPNDVLRAAEGTELVVHAAAETSPRSAPRALHWINTAGTENVLNAVRHAGCRRLVHLSCADVTLTNADRVSWNESKEVPKPLGALAQSKLLAEELVTAASDDDLETVVLRPALLWGPGETRLSAEFCRQGRVTMIGGGRNLIATTYIDNLVDAVMVSLESYAAAGGRFYVTDGEFLEAREFFRAWASALGLAPPKAGLPYPFQYAASWFNAFARRDALRPEEVVGRGRSTCFDVQEAAKCLDYAPRVTLSEGMDAYKRWVECLGGAPALLDFDKPPLAASAVDAQVALATQS